MGTGLAGFEGVGWQLLSFFAARFGAGVGISGIHTAAV